MATFAQSFTELLSNDSNYITIKNLLENGADPLKMEHNNSLTPLQTALKLNSQDIVQLILTYISSGHLRNKAPFILHYACTYSTLECVKCLLEALVDYGSDYHDFINKVDSQERTPLFISILKTKYDITYYLLEHTRADPNINDTNGTYPIHLAAKHGDIDLLYTLKEYGAVFNVQDIQGNTPLHYVSNPVAVEILVMQGNVDPTKCNKRGDTALALARRRGNEDVVESLTEMNSYWMLQHREMDHINWLIWYLKNTYRQLGVKLTLLIVVLCIICSWIFSVYIHQRHPFQ